MKIETTDNIALIITDCKIPIDLRTCLVWRTIYGKFLNGITPLTKKLSNVSANNNAIIPQENRNIGWYLIFSDGGAMQSKFKRILT